MSNNKPSKAGTSQPHKRAAPRHPAVVRRNETFAKRITTRIWEEEASPANPYIADSCRCHGYDILELMQKRPFVDVLYLLFRGELPSDRERQLLEALMVACINPGPRHPATRAAMNAGVGKTDPTHILPIGLTILGGAHLGAGEVELAIRWLRKHARKDPTEVALRSVNKPSSQPTEGDRHIAPGFGSRFGGIDVIPEQIASRLLALPGAGDILSWGAKFATQLHPYNQGWLITGVVAAALCDLGFLPRTAPGFFQLMCAPGILAHGIEMASKPLTDMPFPDDSDYFIEGS